MLGEGGKLRQAHPRLGIDGAVRQQEDFVQLFGADEKQVLQPLVREENVGAVAEDVGGQLVLFQQIADLRQPRDVLGHGQGPGGSADAEGAVRVHGLVLQQRQPRHGLFDLLYGKFQIFHR